MGDFIEGYGGKRNGKVIGWGASENAVRRFQTPFGICWVLTQPTLAK